MFRFAISYVNLASLVHSFTDRTLLTAPPKTTAKFTFSATLAATFAKSGADLKLLHQIRGSSLIPMEEVLELARAKDTKERLAAVERLHQLLEASRKSLSSSEVTSLVDCCLDLLKDNNFRVSQGALQALASAAVLSGEHLKLHFNALVPVVVERLGDGKQPVRDAARRLLLTLMEVTLPPMCATDS